MLNSRIGDYKRFWAMILLILLVSLVTFFALTIWREAQVKDLSPEAVIQAFDAAGFKTNDVRETNSYPGPVTPGERAIEFDILVEGRAFHVHVTQYKSGGEAKRAESAINKLDQRMRGEYAYAFSRGSILVQINPSDKALAGVLSAVLKDIK